VGARKASPGPRRNVVAKKQAPVPAGRGKPRKSSPNPRRNGGGQEMQGTVPLGAGSRAKRGAKRGAGSGEREAGAENGSGERSGHLQLGGEVVGKAGSAEIVTTGLQRHALVQRAQAYLALQVLER
jgi:hypothetical protein